MPTLAFCGARVPDRLEAGEEIAVDIEPGKTLIIRFLTVGEPHDDARRTEFFELNSQMLRR